VLYYSPNQTKDSTNALPPQNFDFQVPITIPRGNYEPTALASTLTTLLNASIPAWYITKMNNGALMYGVNWSIVYNSLLYTFDVSLSQSITTNGYGFAGAYFMQSMDVPMGYPPMQISDRSMQALGWESYYNGSPFGTEYITFSSFGGVALTNWVSFASAVNLGGTDYVDILCSCSTNSSFHPNQSLKNALDRVTLSGGSGGVTHYVRSTPDVSAIVVDQTALQNIRITLLDEWGLPFVLPNNLTVAVTLRLYPIT
jgi:hypothetical protein